MMAFSDIFLITFYKFYKIEKWIKMFESCTEQ